MCNCCCNKEVDKSNLIVLNIILVPPKRHWRKWKYPITYLKKTAFLVKLFDNLIVQNL
jgi:hypothetical protein